MPPPAPAPASAPAPEPAPPELRDEVLQKVAALATAAFGLVAALAWNSLIQGLFARYYEPGEALWGRFVYALAVTAIAVAVTVWIGRASGHLRGERERRRGTA